MQIIHIKGILYVLLIDYEFYQITNAVDKFILYSENNI